MIRGQHSTALEDAQEPDMDTFAPFRGVVRAVSGVLILLVLWALIIGGCCMLTGCAIFDHGGSKGLKVNHPDPAIRDMAYAEIVAAHDCMQAIVGAFPLEGEVTFELVPGYKMNGEWVMDVNGHPSSGAYWVDRQLIQVPCSPQYTGYQGYSIRHEGGHFWQYRIGLGGGHDPRFKGCFTRWEQGRALDAAAMIEGELIIVDWVSE